MKDLIKHVLQRIKCAFGRHVWGETTRLNDLSGWIEYIHPLNGEKVYRRDFRALHSCIHCAYAEQIRGFDIKPHETDRFENTKPTKATSPVNVIPPELAEKLFPKCNRQNPPVK